MIQVGQRFLSNEKPKTQDQIRAPHNWSLTMYILLNQYGTITDTAHSLENLWPASEIEREIIYSENRVTFVARRKSDGFTHMQQYSSEWTPGEIFRDQYELLKRWKYSAFRQVV